MHANVSPRNAWLGSLEILVKDRQSGALSSLRGQTIRPKNSMHAF
jgi:hypothetical protein